MAPEMKRPHKIAWVSAVGEKGGAEVTMLHTFRWLRPELFTPTVFLLRPGPIEKELRDLGVQTFLIPAHRMRNVPAVWMAVLQMKRIIREEGIRLVHSNGFRPHLYGGLAARMAGAAEVWTVHSHERRNLFNRMIWSVPSSQIIANCPRTSDFFKSIGCPNEMIWPGVNIPELERGASRSDLAARYGLPEKARWISMAARLQRYKGQLYFLRSFAAVSATQPDLRAIVIGAALFEMEQDFLAELKREAEKLGILDRVLFPGFIPDADLAGFLAASEVVVHPALDEDFGLSVAEAQALGRPVVAFAAVGPAAIIIEGQTGRLAPIGDQDKLNSALAETLADPAAITRMGKAGRERARALFGIEVHVRKTEDIYLRCIENTAGP
jgi:glycosyltransferase involved in cell wall biosynthesis